MRLKMLSRTDSRSNFTFPYLSTKRKGDEVDGKDQEVTVVTIRNIRSGSVSPFHGSLSLNFNHRSSESNFGLNR